MKRLWLRQNPQVEDFIKDLRLGIKQAHGLNGISGGFCEIAIHRAYQLPNSPTNENDYGRVSTDMVLLIARFGVQSDVDDDVYYIYYILNTKNFELSILDEQDASDTGRIVRSIHSNRVGNENEKTNLS